VERARVRLWLGLDSLLEQCDSNDVETAWNTAITGLSESIRKPNWKTQDKCSMNDESKKSVIARNGQWKWPLMIGAFLLVGVCLYVMSHRLGIHLIGRTKLLSSVVGLGRSRP